MNSQTLVRRLLVDDPKRFRLADRDPADSFGLDLEKDDAKTLLADDIKRLSRLQARLQAEGRQAVLVVLQGMDAAGKDGAIGHVMTGINPQGCQVHAFKAPAGEELEHDFLWRIALRTPRKGHIGIFNRSHYEDVVVARVHPELLSAQRIAPEAVTEKFWQQRFAAIRDFERCLVASGTAVVKFYLHLSKHEQRRRLLERLDDPDKHWKFAPSDVTERYFWHRYAAYYEDAIRETSTPEAPWHVIPADHKWFARLAIAATLVDTLQRLDPQFPRLDKTALKALDDARRALLDDAAPETGRPG